MEDLTPKLRRLANTLAPISAPWDVELRDSFVFFRAEDAALSLPMPDDIMRSRELSLALLAHDWPKMSFVQRLSMMGKMLAFILKAKMARQGNGTH